jgi:hypothetical protein
MAQKKRRRGRPPNEIPSALLEARVPANLVERVRAEADAAGLRLGAFLTQALERGLAVQPVAEQAPDEEEDAHEMWARARELLAELSTKDANDHHVAGRIEVLRQILGEDADGDQLLTEEEVMELFVEAGLTSAQIEEAKKSLGFGHAGEDVVLGDRAPGDLIRVVELLNKIIKHYDAEDRPAIAQGYLNRIAADLQRSLESTKEFVKALRNGEPWAVNAREGVQAFLARLKAKS